MGKQSTQLRETIPFAFPPNQSVVVLQIRFKLKFSPKKKTTFRSITTISCLGILLESLGKSICVLSVKDVYVWVHFLFRLFCLRGFLELFGVLHRSASRFCSFWIHFFIHFHWFFTVFPTSFSLLFGVHHMFTNNEFVNISLLHYPWIILLFKSSLPFLSQLLPPQHSVCLTFWFIQKLSPPTPWELERMSHTWSSLSPQILAGIAIRTSQWFPT